MSSCGLLSVFAELHNPVIKAATSSPWLPSPSKYFPLHYRGGRLGTKQTDGKAQCKGRQGLGGTALEEGTITIKTIWLAEIGACNEL